MRGACVQIPCFAIIRVEMPTRDPRVRIEDDWDGFGQRLTAPSTAYFDGAAVDAIDVHERTAKSYTVTISNAVFRLVQLATLAGLAQAALDEIAEFVQSRPRNLFNPGVPSRKEPVVLQIVGETHGAVETVRAAVLAAARTVDRTSWRQQIGSATGNDYAIADAQLYGIQATIIELVLRTISRVFEVGGASATARGGALDRLWRNARTVASHNPAILRLQAVVDYRLNGTAPSVGILSILTEAPPAP